MMVNISEDNHFVTLINVFTVDPVNLQRLVDLLILATENGIHQEVGFISASLHRNIEQNKVVMYAQWQSREAYLKMRESTTASIYLKQVLTFAEFKSDMYEVVKTILAVS